MKDNSYQRALYARKKDDPEFKKKKSEAAKRSYQRNKNNKSERAKKYRLDNKDKFREYNRVYRTKNPKGIYDVIKQSAKRRSLPLVITQAEFVKWYESQKRECFYCKRSEIDILKDTDIIQSIAKRLTIDRLKNELGYIMDNMCLCCRRCNTIKGNFFTVDEMLLIGSIINKKHNANI